MGEEEALAFMADLHYRGADWDSSRRREYDLVAPLRIRQSDVRRYPQHKAYIYGTTVGIKQANIKQQLVYSWVIAKTSKISKVSENCMLNAIYSLNVVPWLIYKCYLRKKALRFMVKYMQICFVTG